MSEIKTIALLGQPNSGKSTLFNNLTGLHQRVGNWPGKTVEQAEGSFVFDGVTYNVVDLPGSYGLSANSEEEVVTRDYIQSGKADLVCILVDASQLERSLYMLADFVGIRMPVMLVLNMMDVAEAAGKKIDVAAIEKRLGVPVLGFSAAETERYPEFFKKMVSAIKTPVCLDSGSLREELVSGGELGEKTDDIISRIEAALGDFEYGVCERIWIAEKLLEKDKLICGVVNEMLPFARKNAIDAILDSEEGRDGGILTGEAKYRWVSKIVRESATPKSIEKVFSKWDRIATHHIKGKFFAFGIMVVSLIACMILPYQGQVLCVWYHGRLADCVHDSRFPGHGNRFWNAACIAVACRTCWRRAWCLACGDFVHQSGACRWNLHHNLYDEFHFRNHFRIPHSRRNRLHGAFLVCVRQLAFAPGPAG